MMKNKKGKQKDWNLILAFRGMVIVETNKAELSRDRSRNPLF